MNVLLSSANRSSYHPCLQLVRISGHPPPPVREVCNQLVKDCNFVIFPLSRFPVDPSH